METGLFAWLALPALALSCGSGFLVVRWRASRRSHEHVWREQAIGAALVRQVCQRCNEVHLRKQAHQGLDVGELRHGTLFELRPEMFTTYTKPEFLRAMEQYDRRQAS